MVKKVRDGLFRVWELKKKLQRGLHAKTTPCYYNANRVTMSVLLYASMHSLTTQG